MCSVILLTRGGDELSSSRSSATTSLARLARDRPGVLRRLLCRGRLGLGPGDRHAPQHYAAGKERGPRERPPVPVTSGGLAEALSCHDPRVNWAGRRVTRRPPRWLGDFPVGPGDSTSTRWYLHCPNKKSPLSDHLLSAVSRRISVGQEVATQDHGELEASVERDRHRLEGRVRLASLHVCRRACPGVRARCRR